AAAVFFRKRGLEDLRRPPELRALFHREAEDMLVELGPVDLEAWNPRKLVRSRLARLLHSRRRAVVEPVAQAMLGELVAGQVFVESEDSRQEVGGGLDGRFADLPVERGLALDDEDAELGMAPAKEQRGGSTRERASQDHDVVSKGFRFGHESGHSTER